MEEVSELKERERYYRKEFAFPGFKRQFQFPKYAVDATGIKARYDNGILYVTLTKKVEKASEEGHRIIIE